MKFHVAISSPCDRFWFWVQTPSSPHMPFCRPTEFIHLVGSVSLCAPCGDPFLIFAVQRNPRIHSSKMPVAEIQKSWLLVAPPRNAPPPRGEGGGRRQRPGSRPPRKRLEASWLAPLANPTTRGEGDVGGGRQPTQPNPPTSLACPPTPLLGRPPIPLRKTSGAPV